MSALCTGSRLGLVHYPTQRVVLVHYPTHRVVLVQFDSSSMPRRMAYFNSNSAPWLVKLWGGGRVRMYCYIAVWRHVCFCRSPFRGHSHYVPVSLSLLTVFYNLTFSDSRILKKSSSIKSVNRNFPKRLQKLMPFSPLIEFQNLGSMKKVTWGHHFSSTMNFRLCVCK